MRSGPLGIAVLALAGCGGGVGGPPPTGQQNIAPPNFYEPSTSPPQAVAIDPRTGAAQPLPLTFLRVLPP